MTLFVKPAHLQPYRPSQAAALRRLWQSQGAALDRLWTASIAAVQAASPTAGMGLPFSNPRVFERQARGAGDVARLMRGLEGRFLHLPVSFQTWLWALITDVQPKPLYEKLLATLDGHDASYSRRLAALIWDAGNKPQVMAPAEFQTWAGRWQTGISAARGAPPHGAAPRAVLLVPGNSRLGWHWANSSARHSCRTRARAAVPTIRYLLKHYGPRGKLLVVCSGGTVRSPKPESRFIAAELDLQLRKRGLRGRVTLHEDSLSRHTANNARALARLALMNGVPVTDTWIVTDPGHYGFVFRTSLGRQWKRHAMAGLLRSDRTDIEQNFPVTVAKGSPLFQAPPATRGKLSVLRSTALVPSPGNALDP